MAVVACGLYRIEFSRTKVLTVVAQLELLKIFEPVSPLFPVDSRMYQSQLHDATQTKNRVHEVIEILLRHTKVKRQQLKPIISATYSQEITQKKHDLQQIAVAVEGKSNLQAQLTIQAEKAQQARASLELIKDVFIPLFSKSELVEGFILVIDAPHTTAFERSLSDVEVVEFALLAKTPEKSVYAVLIQSQSVESVHELISQPYCEQIVLDATIQAQTPADAYVEYGKYLEKITADQVNLVKELETDAKNYLVDLLAWHDILQIQEDSFKAVYFVGYTPGTHTNARILQHTEVLALNESLATPDSLLGGLVKHETVHIDGWVDPSTVGILRASLAQLGTGIKITELDSQNDPEVRTVLKNNAALRPFEIVTNLMGMPSTQEIDPSPYVAPFFILFFGFALGDAGYGLLMVALVLYLLKNPEKVSKEYRSAFYLLLYCGISTTFFGILTGSWFGADLTAIGSVGNFLQRFKVIDIQANIILMLVLSLITGYIHQLFGLILAIISSLRAGKISEAIQVHGTWLMLLLSFVVAYVFSSVPLFQAFSNLTRPVLYLAGILFVFGQGYGAPWWLRPFKGLTSVFNLTGYLSNTLSYARLIALALATGVIASVVNLIAGMAGGSLPFIPGIIVMGFVLILGHTFNIMLNLLGTFITVARLHLVEFFPRFFEAKGVGLNPFAAQPAYSVFTETFTANAIHFEKIPMEKMSIEKSVN